MTRRVENAQEPERVMNAVARPTLAEQISAIVSRA
jgi:hypothetical protein